MELFTIHDIRLGLITLAMYEFIFRPLIFNGSIKGRGKHEKCEAAEKSSETLQGKP